jgi:ATP-binding cassette, subfamily B, putative efflux pump
MGPGSAHGLGPTFIRPHGPPKVMSLSVAMREAGLLLWAHRYRLALGLVLLVVTRLAALVLPAISKWMIDEVAAKQRWNLLPWLSLAAAAAMIVEASAAYGAWMVLGATAQQAIADIRLAVHAHVIRLPVAYFMATKSGELLPRILTDADGVPNLIGQGFLQFFGSLLTATVALVVLFSLDWRLTLVIMLILGALATSTTFTLRRLGPLFVDRARTFGELAGRLAETLGGIRIIKAYRAERREHDVFADGVQRLLRRSTSAMGMAATTSAFSTVIIGTIGIAVLSLGGMAMRRGTMTVGEFVMYVMLAGLIAAPIQQLATVGPLMTEAFAGLERIRELRLLATEDADDVTRRPVPDIHGDVTFEDVSFEYIPGIPVLKHVSFAAAAGSTTALVGSSGSGKSTLMSLVLGFNRPRSGRVLVDGADLTTLRISEYRAHLGIVLQDHLLFDGTVADNIGYGKEHATRAEIADASRLAHCDEFIRHLDRQYDSRIGERGQRLSAGQQQRVAIARAILANPRILILDEATSSLDSEAEALIQDGLRSLRRERTTFVIAHRLSTIRGADQILVMERGEIVERGTHDELFRAGGRYRQLYERQYGLASNRLVNPGEELSPESTTIHTTVLG